MGSFVLKLLLYIRKVIVLKINSPFLFVVYAKYQKIISFGCSNCAEKLPLKLPLFYFFCVKNVYLFCHVEVNLYFCTQIEAKSHTS